MAGPARLTRRASRLVGCVVVVLVALGAGAHAPTTASAQPAVTAPVDAVDWDGVPADDWPTPPPASARAYVLVDALTGQVLAERDAAEARVVASTVKLLAVLTALETLSVDDEVVVGPAAAIGGAGSSVDPGETWRVGDLLDAVLVRSGNDAALALAEAAAGSADAFVEQMRATAEDIGLQDSTIVEVTGLDDANRLSARDLATVARVALADERIRASAGRPTVDLPDSDVQENRNRLVGTFPGATGLKTGYTDLAGYCLVASARRDGRELVAVVLGAREDPARFDEAAALLAHGFDRFASRELAPLRARHAAGWEDLLPASRLWVPTDEEPVVDLASDGADLTLRVGTAERTLGTARATPAAGRPTGTVGQALANAAYVAMRQAHARSAWPSTGS